MADLFAPCKKKSVNFQLDSTFHVLSPLSNPGPNPIGVRVAYVDHSQHLILAITSVGHVQHTQQGVGLERMDLWRIALAIYPIVVGTTKNACQLRSWGSL